MEKEELNNIRNQKDNVDLIDARPRWTKENIKSAFSASVAILTHTNVQRRRKTETDAALRQAQKQERNERSE